MKLIFPEYPIQVPPSWKNFIFEKMHKPILVDWIRLLYHFAIASADRVRVTEGDLHLFKDVAVKGSDENDPVPEKINF